MPIVWIVVSLLIHGAFKWEIPVKIAAFGAFLWRDIGVLITPCSIWSQSPCSVILVLFV